MRVKNTAEQQKEKFRFTLSKFSHEIRNPISLISSELQIMASSHPEIISYDCWDDIMDNLEYVKILLDELSNYNNAETLCPVPTEMTAYLRSIAASVKPTLDYLGIELKINLPDTRIPLPIDRTKMRQALLNLLRNAQEAISGSHGKIEISAELHGESLSIRIQDNGCGIPTDKLQDIFLPFVTYKSGGTGLGLAITKQIIEAHGGSLDVESTLHKGTVFQIFLG